MKKQTNNPEACRPALHWPGGKLEMLKHLLPLIDGTAHELYCEPFAGGLAVFCAKRRVTHEIINDINSDVVTFYRVVKHHREAFLDELDLVPNSHEDFEAFKAQEGFTDIQRAARWFYRNGLAFSGLVSKSQSMVLAKRSRRSVMDKIDALNARMDRVLIQKRDWKELLKKYDRESALFFFDPPYVNVKPENYAAWTMEQVQDMADTLKGCKCKFVITLNDLPEIRKTFSWCRLKGIMKRNGMRLDHKPYGELIIISPNITAK